MRQTDRQTDREEGTKSKEGNRATAKSDYGNGRKRKEGNDGRR